ncbi:Fic family protein, partial [Patescibacteria group bacterium]|nr:Fic family protein [Patescibacteria group bacterium]
FHLDFETIHPFNDGNGRIGRVLMNFQFLSLGFPRVIIRNKEKSAYYQTFIEYRDKKNSKPMEKILALALMETLHKRITYLKSETVITLSDYTKKHKHSASAVTNAARRQTVPAFREKGVWKIGEAYVFGK